MGDFPDVVTKEYKRRAGTLFGPYDSSLMFLGIVRVLLLSLADSRLSVPRRSPPHPQVGAVYPTECVTDPTGRPNPLFLRYYAVTERWPFVDADAFGSDIIYLHIGLSIDVHSLFFAR